MSARLNETLAPMEQYMKMSPHFSWEQIMCAFHVLINPQYDNSHVSYNAAVFSHFAIF